MRARLTMTAAAAGGMLVAGLMGAAPATAGVTGPAFYVDGELYRTSLTPTDLSRTRAPAHTFDTIYEFHGYQRNVADAKPGDRDYNGGRWMVHSLSFPAGYAAAVAYGDLDGDNVLDSDAEVLAAIAAGKAVDEGVVRMFVCPVIPLRGNG